MGITTILQDVPLMSLMSCYAQNHTCTECEFCSKSVSKRKVV